MANIRALLNPMSEKRTVAPSIPKSDPLTALGANAARKKIKLTKDAPVFQHGSVRGECRFPPDEYQDRELAAYHQQFEVSPFGEIADYPRHIPYNSEKKTFLERTNRECLEVFQYTFKKPGDDTQYTMLWDYNIGLVRTTPLFKCTGHSKTTPAKMLNKNPGLKDICHSITGGALVAQGYWIPHAAAKAIAATFCYDIRHALTPVFGHDFPQMCIKPGTDGFGNMTIDPAITQYCTEEAERFRQEEADCANHLPATNATTRTPSPAPQRGGSSSRKSRPKPVIRQNSPYLSPYESDISSDDNYTLAPSTPPIFRNPWVPVNAPKTPKTPPRSVPFAKRLLPSPRTIMSEYGVRPMRTIDVPITPPPTTVSRDSSIDISPISVPQPRISRLRSTCGREATQAEASESTDKLSYAIRIVSSEIGMASEEIERRLELSDKNLNDGRQLDAAITMESLKTGLAWNDVASHLNLPSDGHKRSASWYQIIEDYVLKWIALTGFPRSSRQMLLPVADPVVKFSFIVRETKLIAATFTHASMSFGMSSFIFRILNATIKLEYRKFAFHDTDHLHSYLNFDKMTAPSSLLTCRYWAFGPGCPNAQGGRDLCSFAHWDTGNLASHLLQRGTCRYWLNSTCQNGEKCWYEHRHTGVEGFHQGPMTLRGLDLEVANAAAKAGFNTWNHVGLFDLIWAVKKIALRNNTVTNNSIRRPPRDPCYPDKYRPSGFGDNTKRKRPGPPSHPAKSSMVNLGSFIERPKTRKPRRRNKGKKSQTAVKDALNATGTAQFPVNLLSDDEEGDFGAGSAKRQKIEPGKANTSQPRAAAYNEPLPYRHGANVNPPTKSNSFGLTQTQNLVQDLRQVRTSLQASARDMGLYMVEMSLAFEKYPDRLAQDIMMPLLTTLRGNIEKAEQHAVAGAEGIGEVMRLVT